MNGRLITITILLVFLAGYAFCAWGVPFLDNIFNTFAVFVQRLQGILAVKITEDSVKVTKLKQEMTEKAESARAIGFVIPDEIEDEEYEEDD